MSGEALLIAFLAARTDEDEVRANAMEHFTVHDDTYLSCPATWTEPYGDLPWGEENCDCGLAPRKARALREVQAKRELITFALENAASIDGEWGDCHKAAEIASGQCEDRGATAANAILKPLAAILKPLAAIYSDHPDYGPAVKP
jgi:Family of unknown function (DUF6221)